MATQKTIAILGALEPEGLYAAHALRETGHRLLLFYKGMADGQSMASLQHTNIEWINCPREASWEADMIILAIPQEEHEAIAADINKVAAGKNVLDIRNNETAAASLRSLLPSSFIYFDRADLVALTNEFLSH